MKEQIVCFHLLNNFSGSPNVLAQIIHILKENHIKVILYTSNTKGFLSDISEIEYNNLLYAWKSNKIFLYFLFFLTQIQLFLTVLIKYPLKSNKVFYINTIMPFGAALACWLLRKKIIYHLHEDYIRPNIMQKFAFSVMRLTATEVIYVSEYLKKKIIVDQPSKVLINTLSPEFCKISSSYLNNIKNPHLFLRNILMISSLRAYKGIFILLELAKSLPEYEFCMVLGSTQKEVIQFKEKFKPTANIAIYSEQSNLHTFYQKADLILNLTIPSLSIESFGITILEGMTYGLPCIVPPIGGPLELVDNGINGFTIDSRDLDLLKKKIIEILSNPTLYRTLSEKAIKKAETFYQNKQIEMIIEDIKNIV